MLLSCADYFYYLFHFICWKMAFLLEEIVIFKNHYSVFYSIFILASDNEYYNANRLIKLTNMMN